MQITWAKVVTFEENGHRFHYAQGGGGRWVRVDQPHCTRAVARVLALRSFSHKLGELRAHYKQEGVIS